MVIEAFDSAPDYITMLVHLLDDDELDIETDDMMQYWYHCAGYRG